MAQVTNQRARVCVRAHSNIARALPLGTPVPSAANAPADLHRQDTPSLRRCPSVCLFRSRPRCRSGSSVVLPRCATPAGGTCERREARLGEIAPNGPHCRGACWCRCRLLLVAQCSASVRPVVLSQRMTIEPTKPHVRPSATLPPACYLRPMLSDADGEERVALRGQPCVEEGDAAVGTTQAGGSPATRGEDE